MHQQYENQKENLSPVCKIEEKTSQEQKAQECRQKPEQPKAHGAVVGFLAGKRQGDQNRTQPGLNRLETPGNEEIEIGNTGQEKKQQMGNTISYQPISHLDASNGFPKENTRQKQKTGHMEIVKNPEFHRKFSRK